MARLLGLGFLVLALHSCRSKKPADVTELVKQATVFVRTPEASGSSFVVQDDGDDQYLLTNEHVVSAVAVGGSVEVTYFAGSGREWSGKATVVVTDPLRDLALLRARAPAKRPQPLTGSTEVNELMPVIIAGFPFGDRLSLDDKAAAVSLSRASISALRKSALGALELLQLDNNINPGNSGGPVVNEQGSVVGISVAAVRGAGIAFVIPWAHANALLEGRALESHISVLPCEDTCQARIQVGVIDPFRKTKRVELRLIEADDQFMQAAGSSANKAEGELLATAVRPASGAMTVLATPSLTPGKRYFVQVGYEGKEMVYGAPFELLAKRREDEPQAPPAPAPRAPPEVARREPEAPSPPAPGEKVCWRMIQIQEIGTKQTAELMLVRAGASAEGSVKFDSHPLASAVAAFSGRGVRLVFTFPNGVVGLYEGAVDERSGDLVEGTCAGSNGATATWSGSRVACPR